MRPVRFLALLFGLIGFAAGLIGLWLSVSWGRDAARLAAEGRTATAEIVEKYTVTDDGRYNGGSTPKLFLRYRFPVPGRPDVDVRERVKQSLYDGMARGDRAPVVYWSTDPRLATLDRDSFNELGWTAQWIAVVGFAIALPLLVVALWPRLRRRRGE